MSAVRIAAIARPKWSHVYKGPVVHALGDVEALAASHAEARFLKCPRQRGAHESIRRRRRDAESPTVTAGLGDEAELARRAAAGDQQAFDLLYERYFARTSWYFTIFGSREAKSAVEAVLAELFGSLTEPSELSFAERAYRLARATELRHVALRKKARSKPAMIAKSQAAKSISSRA